MSTAPVTPIEALNHHHLIDKLAVINGAITGLALYPQIYLIAVSHVPNTLSLVTLWIIFGNNIIWTMYGIHRSLASVTIAGVLSSFAAGILLLI